MGIGTILVIIFFISAIFILLSAPGLTPIIFVIFFILFFIIYPILDSWSTSRQFKIYGKKIDLEGIARKVNIRSEPFGRTTMSILNFRIERTDKKGNIINVMPVEMRGFKIIGNIVDGDRIRVKGKVADGLIRTKEITNMTTNSIVRVK